MNVLYSYINWMCFIHIQSWCCESKTKISICSDLEPKENLDAELLRLCNSRGENLLSAHSADLTTCWVKLTIKVLYFIFCNAIYLNNIYHISYIHAWEHWVNFDNFCNQPVVILMLERLKMRCWNISELQAAGSWTTKGTWRGLLRVRREGY